MTDYDAVVFDSDGVLVEPPARETQAAAARAAFREVGVDDPDDDHVAAVVSGVTTDRLADICATYGLDPDRFWRAREHHDEQSQFAAFASGERDRYDDATVLGDIARPVGVVSNNHHSTVATVLEAFELAGAVDTFYGREKTVESLQRKKPDPHYLDRALADLGAGSALYVGDSESDLRAADRAGIDAAVLRRAHNRERDLPVGPDYEVSDLHELARVVGAE